jgi:hypothetical protein
VAVETGSNGVADAEPTTKQANAIAINIFRMVASCGLSKQARELEFGSSSATCAENAIGDSVAVFALASAGPRRPLPKTL